MEEFKKPDPVTKTALSKMKKHHKKKVVDEESIMLEDIQSSFLSIGVREEEEYEIDEEWIYPKGEKRLTVEAIETDDTTDFGASNDRASTNEVTMVRFFNRYSIKHVSLWKHSTDNKGKSFDLYPLEWTGNCIHCGRPYNTEKEKKVPIFPPNDYDEKEKCWILEIIPQCYAVCSKGKIMESSCNYKERKLSLLARFLREFFIPELTTITYIPLSCIKELNPLGGYMTWEQYDKLSFTINGYIKTPPFMFVNTSIELIDMEEREKKRREHFEKVANTKATVDQQENYKSNMLRVIEERKTKVPSIQESKIGKQLGIVMKNQNTKK